MKRFVSLSILCFFFIAGCAGARWENASVTRHDQYIISLQHRIEGKQIIEQDYRHPAKIRVNTMVRFLRDITYAAESAFFGDPEETAVFQDVEIARLAPELSITFESATSDQRVHFTSFNRGGGFIFKDQRKTEGVMFVDAENRLNIAFSWINEPINIGESSQERMNAGQREATKMDRASTPLVADAPYMRHHLLENGQKAPMWIEADLDALRRAALSKSGPAETAPEEKEAVRAPRKLPPGEAAVEARPVQEPAASAPGTEKWDEKKQRIRSRLEYLKGLYNDGLISKEEYEAKKQQVLEEVK